MNMKKCPRCKGYALELLSEDLICHSCNLNSFETLFEWDWPIDPPNEFDMGDTSNLKEEYYDDKKEYRSIWR